MMQSVAQSYYRGALSLLRFVEQRAGSKRRFGAEAEAAWRQFKGGVTAIADCCQLRPGAVVVSSKPLPVSRSREQSP
jgi:hypothetical protein